MSKSMAIAIAALFFSLTGWGVAAKVALAPPNTVGTQQIVNGSVRLADLHPSAVRLLKGQDGETGPPGPMGLTGLRGLPGQPGPAGLPGKSADTIQLATDIRNLCRAVGEIQNTYPIGTFWVTNFRFTTCFYTY